MSYREHAPIKQNFSINIILLILNIILIQCDTPPNYKDNIIIFNNAKYNSGSINKNGDLLIEYYSEEKYYDMPNYILFYCLSKNGRYCFSDESSYTKEKNIEIDEIIDIIGYYNYYNIYDSKNLFVSLKDDPNKEAQYLFSINPYNSIVELHDFNNITDINHYIWNLNDFFNLTDDYYNFPYKKEIYESELAGITNYIITFIPTELVNEEIKDLSFIKTFIFKSFNEDTFIEKNSIKYKDYINRRIIDTFYMDDKGTLVTISYKVGVYPFRLSFNFYAQNLRTKALEKDLDFNNLFARDTVYFKSLYLKNNFVMFSYFYFNCLGWNDCNHIYIDLYNINFNTGLNKISYSLYCGISDKFFIDFIKINDMKLAFINYNIDDSNGNNKFYIKKIELNEDYSSYEMKEWIWYDLGDYVPQMQMSLFSYNGFLLFTSPCLKKEEINENEINYFSILMIFGYPNGTDSTIDISNYLFDNEEDDINSFSNDFYIFLFQNYTIENNLYEKERYEPVSRIKLVSIPEEIVIKEKNVNDEIVEIKNNSFMSNESNYLFKQNKDLIKTSKYYYIDYQYMVTDSDLNEYYGRTNRLKFKLCHDYCGTCYELSSSNEEQKCYSCLPEYQYDYLYSQKINNNQLFNCAPEGYYFYDNTLIKCNPDNTLYRYYIDKENNNKICFNSNECPSSYPIYNETTKECFYCDFERFKNGECSSNDLTMDSCTQCDYECFKIGGCNFNNYNNTNNDFYEKIINGGYISNYDGNTNMIVYNGNGYAFQITNIQNELNNLNENSQRNFSIVDIKECIDLLKTKNGLESDDDLIIVKYENFNIVSNGDEKSIQYEIFLKNNTKLDLSVCSNININIYIPVELSEKTQKLYESLKEQGYNLFDRNDKFYHEICTLYKSIDGTDVILFDRVNDIYEKNKLECQENCEYSEYSPETKYLKCNCHVTNEEKINTKEPEKITTKRVLKSFFDVLKYSNYKVLRCYNLVFRKITIKKNVGSILSNIYFIGYLISFCIFLYKKMSYLKKEIEKLLQEGNVIKNKIIRLNKDNIDIYNKQKYLEEENIEKEIKERETEENNEVEIIKIKKKKKEPNNTIKDTKKINDVNIGYHDYKKYFENYMKGEKKCIIEEKLKIIIK